MVGPSEPMIATAVKLGSQSSGTVHTRWLEHHHPPAPLSSHVLFRCVGNRTLGHALCVQHSRMIDRPPDLSPQVDRPNATRRRGSGPSRGGSAQREARPLLRCARLNVWENG